MQRLKSLIRERKWHIHRLKWEYEIQKRIQFEERNFAEKHHTKISNIQAQGNLTIFEYRLYTSYECYCECECESESESESDQVVGDVDMSGNVCTWTWNKLLKCLWKWKNYFFSSYTKSIKDFQWIIR